jgi:hypothetical protein
LIGIYASSEYVLQEEQDCFDEDLNKILINAHIDKKCMGDHNARVG